MASIVDRYGQHLEKNMEENPKLARKEIIVGFKAFGWAQRTFPNKQAPACRTLLADTCMQVMIRAYEHPEKTVLTGIFMPCELLMAFDLTPVCAEMVSTFLNGAHAEHAFIRKAEAAGISETYCSYHKATMGAALSTVFPPSKYIVNTSVACDANHLTFRYLAHHFGIPQYFVEVPYEKNEDSVRYVMDQLKELTTALEKAEGHKLDEDRLKTIVARSAKTIENMRNTIPYRKERWLNTDLTSELYEAISMHNLLGSDASLKYSEELLKAYQAAPKKDGVKLVWMHTNPFWQKPVQDLLNNQPDAQIIATELDYDMWRNMDPSDPYRYMAERLVYDAYNGSGLERIQYTKELADELDADGIVLFCHWGCKATSGISALAKQKLEEAGYPVLVLDGDGVDRANSGDGQTATRLQAYMEMLKK